MGELGRNCRLGLTLSERGVVGLGTQEFLVKRALLGLLSLMNASGSGLIMLGKVSFFPLTEGEKRLDNNSGSQVMIKEGSPRFQTTRADQLWQLPATLPLPLPSPCNVVFKEIVGVITHSTLPPQSAVRL